MIVFLTANPASASDRLMVARGRSVGKSISPTPACAMLAGGTILWGKSIGEVR